MPSELIRPLSEVNMSAKLLRSRMLFTANGWKMASDQVRAPQKTADFPNRETVAKRRRGALSIIFHKLSLRRVFGSKNTRFLWPENAVPPASIAVTVSFPHLAVSGHPDSSSMSCIDRNRPGRK